MKLDNISLGFVLAGLDHYVGSKADLSEAFELSIGSLP